MTLKAAHVIAASFTAAVLLAALVMLPSFWAFGQIEASAKARKQASTLVSGAYRLLSAVKDAETGQRGFSLTGNETFLEPYLAVRDRVGGQLQALRAATGGEAARAHLDTAAPLIRAKLAEIARIIEMGRKHDTAGVLAAVGGGQGKLLMDSIRSEIHDYAQIQEKALERDDAELQSDMRRLFGVIVAASFLTLLFALSFAWLAYRESRHRLDILVHQKTQHLLQAQEQTNLQLQQANATLRVSEQKLRLFADNIPAMTASWDEDLRCRFANKAFARFFGLSLETIISMHLREVTGAKAYQAIEHHFRQVLRGHPVTYEHARKSEDGETRYIEVKLLPHIGDELRVLGCFAVMTDITDHKLSEQRIQRVAHHDSLTGLPNRLLFNDRLGQAIGIAKRETRQFALLYLDLDKFKSVNDTLGHGAGDELLKSVAAKIRDQVRASDTVARVGGDEFTVILPDLAAREEAEAVAAKIISALALPFHLSGGKPPVHIGTSIGIAVYPDDARDAEALVQAADAAMYRAKQAGNSFRCCTV